MATKYRFTKVEFNHFKAFTKFTLHIRNFNILVGPNNSGKSTILAAFRILAAAYRRANSRRPEIVLGQQGPARGYPVDLSATSVAEENIFYNYDDEMPATVTFTLSNKNKLTLYFPVVGACYLIPETTGAPAQTPTAFRSQFNAPIGFVPILGPVEHYEQRYGKEAARLALFNYKAARNFRNIWYHYPEKFDEFRSLLQQTWPGMDVEPPFEDGSYEKSRLFMFCPEERIPREIFWAGFGFQVWCQMLTHLIQSNENSLFMIDEPDIYLHADLQRQLFSILKVYWARHYNCYTFTEIITEADVEDIVLINKKLNNAKRIKNPAQLYNVFEDLKSNLNPILTQLAKTKHVIFVEGHDFQIISKFARKLGFSDVANRRNFAVVPSNGFSPERVRSLKQGMEFTLGGKIKAFAIFDKDYRGNKECDHIEQECRTFCDLVKIHSRKEIENFLLIPSAIDRAVERKLREKAKFSGSKISFTPFAENFLEKLANEKKIYVTSQYQESCRIYENKQGNRTHGATINENAARQLEQYWSNPISRLSIIPGKESLTSVNKYIQEIYKVSITNTSIIDAMNINEIPQEMEELIESISNFSSL